MDKLNGGDGNTVMGSSTEYNSEALRCSMITTLYEIRKYQTSDLSVLGDIYARSIRYIGASAYSTGQIAAWSSFPEDVEAFQKWIEGAEILVAVEGEGICVGFGGMEEGGRISSVFVMPDHMRKGVGSRLLESLLAGASARGLGSLTAEASEFSKTLFEKFGFAVVEVESTAFKGVEFERYLMQKNI